MLEVGTIKCLTGDVTTLNWIGPRPPSEIERSLGYRSGRLAQGYSVALLVRPLAAGDFLFAGTTLRSGGRLGSPADSRSEDDKRTHVHDEMLQQYGEAEYHRMQQRVLASVSITGPNRIAKVLPVGRLGPEFSPKREYPMGGGGLQWTLVRPMPFLIAMTVAPDGTATLPGQTLSLAENPDFQKLYAARSRIAQYLATASVQNVGDCRDIRANG